MLHRDAPLYAPLRREPSATTITIRALIQKVRGGEVRVPHFQRPLRWKQRDVIELLDSVWRGYPIGSLLFWKKEASAEKVQIGSAQIQAPAITDAWWVVDGQQRTTALAASLLDLDQNPDLRWSVVFDPEEGRFKPGPVESGRIGLDVPVSALGDLRRLSHWLRDCELDDEAQQIVETAQQRLLDYSVPAYVVETDDEQALRAVFARVNSTGARMRADEVFQALLGASSSDDQIPDLDRLQRDCEVDGFGTLPRGEILKALLAMSGRDPTARPSDFRSLPALVSMDSARDALHRTIAFLRDEARLPHVRLIPYPVVFVILAKWFYHHPRASETTRVRLSRWVWRGAETGAHQRAAVSDMRVQIRHIDHDEEASVRRLLDHLQARTGQAWDLKPFDLRSARSRIETLALFDQGPKDLLGPIRLEELMADGRAAKEIFRASEWRTCAEETVRRAKTAANRVMLGETDTGLAGALRQFQWDRHLEILSSHLIDEATFEFLLRHDLRGFLDRRAQAVRNAVERLFTERCEWEAPSLAPLESYLDSEVDSEL